MPSPFPGMNPYFERAAHWQDFHTELLTITRRLLVPQLGRNYIVQIGEYIHIRDTDAMPRRADVGLLPTQEDEERLRFLEVRDRRGRELVTVIELLSPSNKRAGQDREQYLTKRRGILRSPVHLVEIDLLRGWTPLPMKDRPACDYSVLVSRAERRPLAGFWGIGLRDRLPEIPIPLRAEDEEVRVDLQDALNLAYDEAGYAHSIYEGRPEPALSASDAAWAEQFLPAA
jgi:hypothetical protein